MYYILGNHKDGYDAKGSKQQGSVSSSNYELDMHVMLVIDYIHN